MDISGGTFNENGWITMTRGSAAGQIGILNITGGTVNTGNDASIGGMIAMGAGAATAAPTIAVINVTNASINGPARSYEMRLSDGGGAGSLGVVNLNQNGSMTISRVNAATVGPTTFFNFNGGTLKASITNVTNFMTSANLRASIFSAACRPSTITAIQSISPIRCWRLRQRCQFNRPHRWRLRVHSRHRL